VKHKHLDEPGAENIHMSPMHRDQRAIERLAIAKARGIQPTCLRCRRSCKVLRGTAGTRAKFTCHAALAKT
jgi:hypothetical protein